MSSILWIMLLFSVAIILSIALRLLWTLMASGNGRPASCTLPANDSLQRRGAYVGEVLRTLQNNFQRRQPTASDETLRQVRHMLGCYEVLLSEIDQELEMLGLELFGQGLCKLFYQLMEVVKWLVALIAHGSTPMDSIQPTAIPSQLPIPQNSPVLTEEE